MYDTTKEDWKDVPLYLLWSLVGYAQHREPLGHFLTAVLEDRLGEAVARADYESIKHIRGIVLFVYNELPSVCYGSPAKVKAWLTGRDA